MMMIVIIVEDIDCIFVNKISVVIHFFPVLYPVHSIKSVSSFERVLKGERERERERERKKERLKQEQVVKEESKSTSK